MGETVIASASTKSRRSIKIGCANLVNISVSRNIKVLKYCHELLQSKFQIVNFY